MVSIANNNTRPESVMKRQKRFLKMYSEMGSIRGACKAINVNRETVRLWKNSNMNNFNEAFEEAELEFADYLNDITLERIKLQKPSDNPALLIAALNARHPKYNADSKQDDDNKINVLATLSAMMEKAVEEDKTIIDGEVKVVDEDVTQLLQSKKG
tara:strand:+ start:2650 stop:3117 length:468 start_codon:yes stop_codon:yes gene_type:complete